MKAGAGDRFPTELTDRVTGHKISLYDYKTANIRYSWLLAVAVAFLLAGVAYLAAQAFDPAAAAFYVGIAVVLASLQSGVAYWFSDRMALAAARAREATADEHRYLVNVTEAVAIGAGVPTPKIYVIDSPSPNAFATGRNPENSAVAVTTGLMSLLDRQELEGVIAHEMAHIRNYDILFTSMLVAMVGALLLLRDLVYRSVRYGGARGRGRRQEDRGGGQAIAMVLLVVVMVVAPLLGMLLRMAVSRRREYLADATGAYITRNPEGLARALEKLRDYRGDGLQASEAVQHMFFVNPVMNLNATGLFATHPPIEERISRLRRL
jgi:heat shock protein HtpX